MGRIKLVIVLVLLPSFCFGESFRTIKTVDSVGQYDDVRWKDLSEIKLIELRRCIRTLTFNADTIWPDDIKPFTQELMNEAKVPPFGIRELHKRGITGKGVNVGIIDQPLLPDHPEFKGKISAYHDTGCGGSSTSMHGPAVTSLLVGNKCGVAPEARVYYAAAPSWKTDAAYYAEALDWIVGMNETLGANEKIRVVSVSAAPSGRGSPFKENNEMWDRACERADSAGILILDCSSNRGFISPCYYNCKDPNNLHRARAGFPNSKGFSSTRSVCAPCSPRTSAEQYEPNEFSYQYNGKGGLSWSIPYTAGVFALGWQLKPEYSADKMKELLIASAYSPRQGGKIINPLKFIEFVENSNLAEKQLDENKVREEDVSQNPVGFWKSVDFVDSIEDFVPGQKLWSGDLHLKSMVFKKDGTTSSRVTWKKTRIIDRSSKASAEFVIKKLNGRTYMFFPWLSGDVTIRGMKPSYYVLQKSER